MKIIKVNENSSRLTLADRDLPNGVGWSDDGEFFLRIVGVDGKASYHVYLGEMSSEQAMMIEEAMTGLQVDSECFPMNPTEKKKERDGVDDILALLRRRTHDANNRVAEFLTLAQDPRVEFLFRSAEFTMHNVEDMQKDLMEALGKIEAILHHLTEHPGQAFDMKFLGIEGRH